jgi:predicted nucleic acid-binding protein
MTKEIIIDASVASDFVISVSKRRELMAFEFFDGTHDFHAPTLIDFEVTSTIRKQLLARRVSEDEAFMALEEHLNAPILRHAAAPLLTSALRLRENISAYDASYVVLAQAFEGLLITRDARLARAAERHCAVVVV